MANREQENTLVLSYLQLRKIVGLLGVSLPVVLVLGDVVISGATGLRDSISAYHGSVMGGVFVGFLFAIGVFLYSYQGYEPEGDRVLSDDFAGNLSCLFALGVALFPTTSSNQAIRAIHFIAATALFLVLSYFSLRLFTKTNPAKEPTDRKKTRNKIYVTCGVIMLVCIGFIALYSWLLRDTSIARLKPIFWLEVLALWAFGVSWFIKGEALLKDEDSADAAGD